MNAALLRPGFDFALFSLRSSGLILLLDASVLGAELDVPSTNVPRISIRQAAPRKLSAGGNASENSYESRAAAIAALVRERWPAARIAGKAVPGGDAQEEAEAIRQLRGQAGTSLEIYLRPENMTPMQIKGQVLRRPGPQVGDKPDDRDMKTARAFLGSIRRLLRLENPDAELKLVHQETDASGRRRLRFTQTHQGLAVWPAELSVHFDQEGNLDLLEGAFVPTPRQIDRTPLLKMEEAVEKARARMSKDLLFRSAKPERIIFAPVDEPARLAWRFESFAGVAECWQFVIDATDGAALQAVNTCRGFSVAG